MKSRKFFTLAIASLLLTLAAFHFCPSLAEKYQTSATMDLKARYAGIGITLNDYYNIAGSEWGIKALSKIIRWTPPTFLLTIAAIFAGMGIKAEKEGEKSH